LTGKSTGDFGPGSRLGIILRPAVLIALLGLLLSLSDWGERTAYAQTANNPPEKRPEGVSPEPPKGIGTQEIPREGGGKDKIYYSTITPEEEEKTKREEKEKEEKSWDLLKNIIIDHRRR
jgi:hypothetical protein